MKYSTIVFSLLISPLVFSETSEEKVFSKRKKETLREQCDFIASRGKIVMVPKGSILFTPKHLENKIVTLDKDHGTFTDWKSFLAANGSWIHLFQVNFDQASGKTKIPKEQIESLANLNKMVIACRGNNIISVAPSSLIHPQE